MNTTLSTVGEPPYDYPGAVYDPGLWAEVGMLPPVEPYVRQIPSPYADGSGTRYSCGAQVWVYYASEDRWYLDHSGTGASSLEGAMARALSYVLELTAHRAAIVQENATVIDGDRR